MLDLPLDHARSDGETIEVFAREVAAPDGLDRPFLVFLQGGPGQEAPRPTGRPGSPVWLARALRDFRVLMLDQRGTGLSTPYGAPGDDPVADPEADAERLTHYRADAIVQDAECFREHLGVEKWSVLGQSFGGFCSLHYLSVAPDSLREVFFTGGLSAGRATGGRHVCGHLRHGCASSTTATTGSSRRTPTGSGDCSSCATPARSAVSTATPSASA